LILITPILCLSMENWCSGKHWADDWCRVSVFNNDLVEHRTLQKQLLNAVNERQDLENIRTLLAQNACPYCSQNNKRNNAMQLAINQNNIPVIQLFVASLSCINPIDYLQANKDNMRFILFAHDRNQEEEYEKNNQDKIRDFSLIQSYAHLFPSDVIDNKFRPLLGIDPQYERFKTSRCLLQRIARAYIDRRKLANFQKHLLLKTNRPQKTSAKAPACCAML
jgi:hypothetical protein